MANAPTSLPADYWHTFTPGKREIEFISTYLFDHEIPLTEKELVPLLVQEHINIKRETLIKEKLGSGKTYLPKDDHLPGDQLVFPAFGWSKGKVINTRPGINPGQGPFSVIEVEFENGIRSFASGLQQHKLNQPIDVAADDIQLNPDYVNLTFGQEIEQRLANSLVADSDLARIAGRWFPRALLVDVNMGHLNLAEAVLEEAGGVPLPVKTLIEQIDLPAGTNPNLMEFSMNYALQEDGRFDEVGPEGQVLWCLKRLEPADVQKIPAPLHHIKIVYDASLLTPQMQKLISEIDDELSEPDPLPPVTSEAVVSLTYPHWRAGTLPISAHMRGIFPTAYESPRVRFTLLDSGSGQEIPAWAVLQHRYVAGLAGFYKKYELFPGSLIVVARGNKPGQAVIKAKTRRPIRDWVRTVLVGSDGGIVFAMLKQNMPAEYNERMVVAVPDVMGVDDACAQIEKERISLEKLVSTTMKELVKLNVQGHVHAQELYSALNIMRRCPPDILLAHLVENRNYKHVGDLHFRIAEMETVDE